MNEQLKIYCDGAAMAYTDAANKLEQLRKNAPTEVAMLFDALIPFEESLRAKAVEVYRETERFVGAIRQ